MKPPCKNCERKGCGAFHDECAEYQAYVGESATAWKRRREETDAWKWKVERIILKLKRPRRK